MPTADLTHTACLYHVADNEDVESARASGVYKNATLLRDGFIHACYLHQLGGVLERYYGDVDDVQLMLIDPEGLATPVVDENLIGGSELFPHLYGELAMSSVIECVPFSRQAAERQSMGHVVIERKGAVGYLTLNRPKALNAIDLPMIQLLEAGLAAHQADALVQLIVIRSADPRAFCAGGDIKRVYTQVVEGDVEGALAVLTAEYRLNASIAACSKSYVAMIDGIAMGGGLGLSIHGSHRIVSERVKMAMPECRIGFIPDVGSTYFLPRLAERAGIWLGMTSMSISGFETLVVGLATHVVPQAEFTNLMKRLESLQAGQSLDEVIDSVSIRLDSAAGQAAGQQLEGQPAPDAEQQAFQHKLDKIGHWFAGDSMDGMEQALSEAATDDQEAADILQAWNAVSPHARSMAATLLAKGAQQDLQGCLDAEWEAARSIIAHPDFREGVKALLIDKDQRPTWSR